MLIEIVRMLVEDSPLPERYFDHPLTGEWKDYRDLHIRPDLVLIDRKPNNATLELVRIGSHSELGIQNPSLPAAGSRIAKNSAFKGAGVAFRRG